MINKKYPAALWLFLFILFSASSVFSATAPIRYVATIQPLAEIIKNITTGRGEVIRLLSPGTSPHTFEPSPADLREITGARILFYAGPGLDKEWVGRLPGPVKVEMAGLIPKENILFLGRHMHSHGTHSLEHEEDDHHGESLDPHFWTDPMTVKALLPGLVDILSDQDPEGAPIYRANAAVFAEKLSRLDRDLVDILKPVRNKSLFLFHPSFNYFLRRYQLNLTGLINPYPNRESSPKYLVNILRDIKKSGAKAIFKERQLPVKTTTVIAEAAGVEVYELDPLGGGEDTATYGEMLLYNARTINKALAN